MKKIRLPIAIICAALFSIALFMPVNAVIYPDLEESTTTVVCPPPDGSTHECVKICFDDGNGCEPDPNPCG